MRRLVFAASYVVSVAAIVALVSGATYGFLSATASSQSSSFSAGTVSLTNDVTGACAVSNLLPAQTATPCTLTASYHGSVGAYMGLDVLIETQHAAGGTDLFKPTDGSNDLQVGISSTSPTVAAYSIPASANQVTCTSSGPTAAPAGSTCYELDNELVNTAPLSSGTVTFTTALSLPVSSTTGYQGGTAQVFLTAHTVQASNNPTVAACGTPGQVCTGSWN